MDLLINDENKSYYAYIKDLCSIRQNIKINIFADIVYNVILVKESCKNIERYV